MEKHKLNCIVAAVALTVTISLPSSAAMAQARLPDIDTLYEELGQADQDEARKLAKEIQRLWSVSGSSSIDLILKRGRDALEAGDTEIALGHFTALTDHAPDLAEAWFARATAYFRLERPGQALSDLERALALEPRHFEALVGLAVLLESLDQPELAYEAYEQVLTIHPHHEDVTKALTRLERRVKGNSL